MSMSERIGKALAAPALKTMAWARSRWSGHRYWLHNETVLTDRRASERELGALSEQFRSQVQSFYGLVTVALLSIQLLILPGILLLPAGVQEGAAWLFRMSLGIPLGTALCSMAWAVLDTDDIVRVESAARPPASKPRDQYLDGQLSEAELEAELEIELEGER